jgi:TonB family protein
VLIDEQGVPSQIAVLSPAGFGMDEAAMTAVAKWRYSPTTVDGKPVSVITQITINFSLEGIGFDKKEEKQRTAYNVALSAIKQKNIDQKTVDSLRDLAQKFAPAMYLYGAVLEEGRNVDKNPDQGFQLVQASADKQYGPALYEAAKAKINGDRLQKDPAKGLELMQSAAKVGSQPAQFYLGIAYETCDGMPMDFEKSRQYFRLCAAVDDAACQFRLGNSLLGHSDHPDRDHVQAIAWLQFASNHGTSGAASILEGEDRLTPNQVEAVKKLMPQLVHRQ